MSKIVLSCKKATELMEIREENDLSFKNNIQLKMHLLMCKACRQYEKQSQLIHQVLSKHYKFGNSTEIEQKKNDALKEKIKTKIDNAD